MNIQCVVCEREYPDYMFANENGITGNCYTCHGNQPKIEKIPRRKPDYHLEEMYEQYQSQEA